MDSESAAVCWGWRWWHLFVFCSNICSRFIAGKKRKKWGVLLSENNNWMKAISLDLSKCFIHNCKIVKSYYINSNFIIEICTEFWLNHWWKPVLDLISSFTCYWCCHMCQVVAAEFQNESAVALAAAATRHLQEAEQARNAGSEHW